jgi:hypothetical protein
MKQTAVEWFAKNLKDFPHIKHSQSFKDLVIQAKEMEKEQIMEAYMKAKLECIDTFGLNVMKHKIINDSEQYYNETFKSE